MTNRLYLLALTMLNISDGLAWRLTPFKAKLALVDMAIRRTGHPTMEMRNSDSLDFFEVTPMTIKELMARAYAQGLHDGTTGKVDD